MEGDKKRDSGYTVRISKYAEINYKKIPKKTRLTKEKIDRHIKKIQKNPYDFKKMEGGLKGYFSYKIDPKGHNYRILYKVIDSSKMILIDSIDKRKRVYENMERRIAMHSEVKKGVNTSNIKNIPVSKNEDM